jgi:hypothetical protein
METEEVVLSIIGSYLWYYVCEEVSLFAFKYYEECK